MLFLDLAKNEKNKKIYISGEMDIIKLDQTKKLHLIISNLLNKINLKILITKMLKYLQLIKLFGLKDLELFWISKVKFGFMIIRRYLIIVMMIKSQICI